MLVEFISKISSRTH